MKRTFRLFSLIVVTIIASVMFTGCFTSCSLIGGGTCYICGAAATKTYNGKNLCSSCYDSVRYYNNAKNDWNNKYK